MEEGIVLKYFLAEKAYTRKENKQIKKDAQEYTAHFFSLYNIAQNYKITKQWLDRLKKKNKTKIINSLKERKIETIKDFFNYHNTVAEQDRKTIDLLIE